MNVPFVKFKDIPSDFRMTMKSLTSKNSPRPHPSHQPADHVYSARWQPRPACSEEACVCSLGYLQRVLLGSAEGLQHLHQIRMNITLSRPQAGFVYPGIASPRYQLMASNAFYGLTFGQTQFSSFIF